MSYAELRSTEFAFGLNCTPPADLVGGLVCGSLNAPRTVVRAEALFRGFHELDDRLETDQACYATVYQYPLGEYGKHVRRQGSPKGYSGPAACSRLVWDLDRQGDLETALADTRKLAKFLMHRYGSHGENGLGAYFSGSKGFHLTLIAPPGFHPLPHVPAVVRLLCQTLATGAGVSVDLSVYDTQRLFRLTNSRHPKTGSYKRFLQFEELFSLDAHRIRQLAEHPAVCNVPYVSEDCSLLGDDWIDAERRVLGNPATGMVRSGLCTPSSYPVVPKFVRDFIGFSDIQDPGRAVTLFRCAAALAEPGTPESVVRGLLEEPALKSGLDAREVSRQLAAGIAHGRKAGVCHT